MRNLRPALLLTILLPAVAAVAADRPKQEPRPLAPSRVDQALVRQVTIVKRGTDTVEEYRTAGKLFMLKVTPAKGAPYLLVDEKGDGTMTRKELP